MRYRIQIERLVIGYFVVITGYEDSIHDKGKSVDYFTIPWEDMKVDDLQHILEQVYRAVSESTP